jgi:uncharacterized protein (UPF0335 family)
VSGGANTDEKLEGLLGRIENLSEERKGISDDIRDVFAEGKALGYDTKIMREVLKQRAMKPDVRKERNALIETYANSIGLELL